VARAGRKTAHAAGLVNAVLRKVAAEGEAWAGLPPQRLPGWLRGRLLSAWGAQAVAAIERAHAAGAPLDLTPRDGDAAALAARLGGAVAATVLPTGSLRLSGAPQVSALPGFAEGAFWVQDAAAALPARVLAPRPGERVADLCAAPGGKTLQLAAAGAEVTAVDVSADRMARLAENLARTGLAAHCVVADARDWRPEAPPDAILLDAPCTATGTIRRHPDLPFVRRPEDVKPLVALQADLIDRALALLRPGGRLLYATCSLLPEEGERQVAAALARHPGLAADPGALALPGVEPDWRTPEGGLRLRPDFWAEAGGMDGFYLVLCRKPG
jgi:16S rRNA (cytosine967-C5)-methyltransferase